MFRTLPKLLLFIASSMFCVALLSSAAAEAGDGWMDFRLGESIRDLRQRHPRSTVTMHALGYHFSEPGVEKGGVMYDVNVEADEFGVIWSISVKAVNPDAPAVHYTAPPRLPRPIL
jgi:hypothetical protein